jgi:hypothetical protein
LSRVGLEKQVDVEDEFIEFLSELDWAELV